MSTLADKLKALGVEVEKPQTEQTGPQHPIEEVVPGRLVDTPHGQAFAVEQRYPVDLQHGCATLRIDAPLDAIAAWAREPQLAELGTEMLLVVENPTDLFLAAVGHDAEAAGGLLSQELTAATEPSRTMLDPAADARANEPATQARLILGIMRQELGHETPPCASSPGGNCLLLFPPVTRISVIGDPTWDRR